MCLALAVFSLYAVSRVVHVRYATVYLRDLPAAFEGTTVLFVSDLDIQSDLMPVPRRGMMRSLSALQPDILLLGGDYTSPGLWETVNGMQTVRRFPLRRVQPPSVFFRVGGFYAPLGKFAVAAADDVLGDQLEQSMQVGGVRLLDGGVVTLSAMGSPSRRRGFRRKGTFSNRLHRARRIAWLLLRIRRIASPTP